MAIKHIEEYYDQMCEQYKALKQEIKEFEQDAANNLIAPEVVEDLKKSMQPLLDNWKRISYFMYLLHKPTKKTKHSNYDNQKKGLLKEIGVSNSGETVLEENRKVLEEIKNVR